MTCREKRHQKRTTLLPVGPWAIQAISAMLAPPILFTSHITCIVLFPPCAKARTIVSRSIYRFNRGAVVLRGRRALLTGAVATLVRRIYPVNNLPTGAPAMAEYVGQVPISLTATVTPLGCRLMSIVRIATVPILNPPVTRRCGPIPNRPGSNSASADAALFPIVLIGTISPVG